MKKVISLLLAVMVLSLSACGGNETATNNDDGSSITQNQTDVPNTSSTTNNTSGSDSTDVPNSTTSTPTTTTKPETSKPTTTTKPSTPTHTHSYAGATCTAPAKCSCGETNGNALGHSYGNATCTKPKKCTRCGATNGSALGHKWQEATCTAPKTCSVCKITSGNKAKHIYEGVRCKVCNNPLEKISTLSWGMIEKADKLTFEGYYYTHFTILDFKNNLFANMIGFEKEQLPDEYKGYDSFQFKVNDVDYVATAGDAGYGENFNIKKCVEYEDEENITIYPYLYEYSNKEYIKFKRLNQTDLIVVENTASEWYNFEVGKILKLVNISIN